jgi:serine phosphatase RsbU (regulator of sigma subunit)
MPHTPGGAATGGMVSSVPADLTVIDLLSSPVRARSHVRRFVAGDVILREGDPGADAFILLSGRCEVLVHGERLSVISPGELFGEIACLGTGVRSATVRAVADSDVLELAGDAVRAELQRSPALLDRFLVAMANRVRDISRREATVRDEQRELRKMLESMQPSLERFRTHPMLSVDVRWQPFSFGSGDYYDVLELSANRLLFALGDVMGHGVPTTPIVGMMRGQLHELASSESRPDELLAHLHRHLQRHGPPNVFMTLTLLLLDLESLTAEFAIAGPPCPLLWRDDRCTALSSEIGWTLGYPFGGNSFQSERLAMRRGDILLFFTDGVSDAARGPDPDEDALGVDGLAKLFSDACSGERTRIAERVFGSVESFRAGWPAEDDATALVVSVA